MSLLKCWFSLKKDTGLLIDCWIHYLSLTEGQTFSRYAIPMVFQPERMLLKSLGPRHTFRLSLWSTAPRQWDDATGPGCFPLPMWSMSSKTCHCGHWADGSTGQGDLTFLGGAIPTIKSRERKLGWVLSTAPHRHKIEYTQQQQQQQQQQKQQKQDEIKERCGRCPLLALS